MKAGIENGIEDFRNLESIPENEKVVLSENINRYLELREKMRALEEEQRELRDQIMIDLSRLGIEKTRYEAFLIQVKRVERRSLDREKLIELGVPPSIIRQAENISIALQLDIREQKKKPAIPWEG